MTEQNWEERVDAAVRAVRAEQSVMTDSARATAKARLTATMQGEPETVIALAPHRERRRTRWAPLVAAAAAVLVAGTAVVALSGDDAAVSPASSKSYPEVPPQPPGPDAQGRFPQLPPVSDVPLNSAERFAGQGSDLPQGPDQYLLVTTRTWNYSQADTPERLEMGMGSEELRQDWIPADRAGEWLRSFDRDVNRPAPAPTERNRPAPNQATGATSSEGTLVAPRGDYLPTSSWYEDPANFPADGRVLYERYHETANTRSFAPVEFLTEIIVNTLSRGDLTHDQRSVVYQALSYHPYLRVFENVRTKDGRHAVAIGVDDITGTSRREVLVDPVTTQVIGTRMVALKDDPLNAKGGGVLPAKAGDVVTESSITYQVVGQRGAVG